MQFRRFSPLCIFCCLFGLLGGAGAGAVAALRVPVALRDGVPELRQDDFRLARAAHEAVRITPARWLSMPFRYGDFDLELDLTMAAGTEFDVLLRQVEPRLHRDHWTFFHGRFEVLRLSTATTGPGFLDRAAALSGVGQGGLLVAAGVPATVLVEARGQELRANVAGRWLPPVRAVDYYGMLTLIARGGEVELRRAVVRQRGLPLQRWWQASTWWLLGGCLGALLGGLSYVLRGGQANCWQDGLAVAVAMPLGALAASLLLPALPELALPPPSQLVLVLLGALAAGLMVLPQRPQGRWRHCWRLLPLLTVGAAAPWLRGVAVPEPAVLDAWFGPRAGAALSEALAQRVRGPYAVHTLAAAGNNVFLLGGQLLYDRGEPAEHLEVLLGGELRLRRGRQIQAPCLPTVDGHAQQQWRLFQQFYLAYQPSVLVFGIGRDEAVAEAGSPRSSPAQLRETLLAVQQHCAAARTGLVLFSEAELPAELQAELAPFAAAGVPLVVAAAEDQPAELAQRLAVAVDSVWPAP